MSSIAEWIRPHAVRTAEPHPDREPERRNMQYIAPPDPEPPRIDARKHKEAAVKTWRQNQARALSNNASGDMTRGRGFVGQNEQGRVELGAHSSLYDSPRANPDDHHTFPITVSGCVMFQQGPAVHVKRAVYADSDDGKRVGRELRRAHSERAQLDEELRRVDPDTVSRSKMLRAMGVGR